MSQHYKVAGIAQSLNLNAEELVSAMKQGFKLEKLTSNTKSLSIQLRTAPTSHPEFDEDGFLVGATTDSMEFAYLNHTKAYTNAQLLKSFKDRTFKLNISTTEDGEILLRWLIPIK